MGCCSLDGAWRKDGKDMHIKLPKMILNKLASAMPSKFIVHNHKGGQSPQQNSS